MSDIEEKPLRLWVMRVVRSAYVLATDEEDAKIVCSNVDKWEVPTIELDRGDQLIDGWSEDALVYNARYDDVTLGHARALYPVAESGSGGPQ